MKRAQCDDNDHDAQHVPHCLPARDRSDLLARHLAERLAVSPDGRREDHEILHRAAQRHADDDPDDARQVAELRGERWSDEGSGTGDGGEMAAEDDPSIRRHVISAVFERPPASPGGVERKHFGRDQLAIETVCDGVAAKPR
jgi:hypothetical protein